MPFQAWASCPATIVYRPRPYRHTTARLALLYAKSEAVQWRNGAMAQQHLRARSARGTCTWRAV